MKQLDLGSVPDTFFDRVAVDRAVAGEPVGRKLSKVEKREAFHVLRRRGYGLQEIHNRLRIRWTLVKEFEGTS